MHPIALRLAALVCALALAACSDRGRTTEPINAAVWPMHPIDARFRGGNGIGAADVDGDGFTDYVTNYEFDQRYEIAFHPGEVQRVREPWPTSTAFVPEVLEKLEDGINPESADFGDVDGDGAIDVVAGQGWGELPTWEGSQPGIRVIWGPEPARARDAASWQDGGRVPATIDRGHFHWVRTHDVNGDGLTDVVYGGRVHGGSAIALSVPAAERPDPGNGMRAGLGWIEAPADPALRRDLSLWKVHPIDPAQWSGHGFVFADLDGDGDADIADANADFDTEEEDETIHWYENPGPGSDAQRARWPYHEIERRSDFDGKPQIGTGDLDGDGDVDLVTAVRDRILWYRNDGGRPLAFTRIDIVKDPRTVQFTRPVRLVDLNGDGRLDIFAMLVHEDRIIPYDRAAAFWMEWRGDAPASDDWTTHVVKWGSGQTMFLPTLGEKWDQVEFDDVDRDGDLDIVANCEEWWEDGGQLVRFWESYGQSTVAVVWFENRMFEEPYRHAERDGTVDVQAELYTDAHDGSWLERGTATGYTGHGYVIDHHVLAGPPRAWDETRGLEYAIDVAGGSYEVWVRRRVPTTWGTLGRGGEQSDSAWIGVDGAPLGTVPEKAGPDDLWEWVRVGSIDLERGVHTLQLRVREGGLAVDRIALTTASSPPR
ncbi:MAG: VCBS repeat-containing protein [Deltaproteobacteria bacterium]|nr:VCBS repeat-containing protein [Deltaproteobacteria bacterium]